MAKAAKRGGLFTTVADIKRAAEPRDMHSNKYSNGAVLVLGGGKTYTGAPVLSSFAANAALSSLRTGTGYVSLLVEKAIEGIEKKMSPNLVVRSFAASSSTASLLKKIASIRHNVLVVGPGTEPRGPLYRSMRSVIETELECGNIAIIDGGALKAAIEKSARLSTNIVLTPHSGEFASLGYRVSDELDDRMDKAVEFSERYDCTLVLKGHETIVTNGASIRVNRAKTPALATMGTGDVLVGMIAAYAAMHGNAFESAVAGVTAHSMIGDMLHARMGNHVIATDLIDAIPSFLKRFDR